MHAGTSRRNNDALIFVLRRLHTSGEKQADANAADAVAGWHGAANGGNRDDVTVGVVPLVRRVESFVFTIASSRRFRDRVARARVVSESLELLHRTSLVVFLGTSVPRLGIEHRASQLFQSAILCSAARSSAAFC